MIYLGLCYFVFFLFGTICVSCMWISISFFPFGKCSAMMSSNMFSILFSLFLFWNLLLCLLTCFIAAYTYHFLLSFLFFFKVFLSIVLFGWFSLFSLLDLSSGSLMHPSVSFYQLFIAFRLLLVSEMELSIFDSVNFMVSSSLFNDLCLYC